MPAERIIFHWAPSDDPDGNWQHVFEGHDVEPEEVEAFIEHYWDDPGACWKRRDGAVVVVGESDTGRMLFAVVEIVDPDPLRVSVITCYPIGL